MNNNYNNQNSGQGNNNGDGVNTKKIIVIVAACLGLAVIIGMMIGIKSLKRNNTQSSKAVYSEETEDFLYTEESTEESTENDTEDSYTGKTDSDFEMSKPMITDYPETTYTTKPSTTRYTTTTTKPTTTRYTTTTKPATTTQGATRDSSGTTRKQVLGEIPTNENGHAVRSTVNSGSASSAATTATTRASTATTTTRASSSGSSGTTSVRRGEIVTDENGHVMRSTLITLANPY